jgi:hypothetical protein
MDRQIFYPGQVPLSAQFLNAERNKLLGAAKLAEAVMGLVTVATGLTCIPTVPASLSVSILPGELLVASPLDASPFGSLASDGHTILKQGYNLDTTPLTLVPPSTSGHAVNVLIQASLSETDADLVVLPYVNAANPSVPFTGPGNTGSSQPTVRRARVVLSAKPGIAVTSGTQVTPAPDEGYIPLFVVTLSQGQTSINSGHIALHPSAPFLLAKLPEVPRKVQSGEWVYAAAGGTANAPTITLTPVPLAPPKLLVVKVLSDNTGAATITIAGLATYPLKFSDGSALAAGTLKANQVALLAFDGANYQLASSQGEAAAAAAISATTAIAISATTAFKNLPIFPEIETGANSLTVTPSTGQVVIGDSQTFIHRGWTQILTSSFSEPNRTLATVANKTYHLRWHASGTGNATPSATYPNGRFLLKDVADVVYNPSSLADGNSALDTTFDDMLIAKVVTNGSNLPTVTALKNKARLSVRARSATFATSGVGAPTPDVVSLNWARMPLPRFMFASAEVDNTTAENIGGFGLYSSPVAWNAAWAGEPTRYATSILAYGTGVTNGLYYKFPYDVILEA